MRSSLAAVLLVSARCDAPHRPAQVGAPPAQASAPPSASASSSPAASGPAPADAAAATPVAALPASPSVPAELAAAPAWICRDLQADAVRAEQSLTTHTLQRVGGHAIWTETRQSAPASLRGGVGGAGRTLSTKTLVGTVEPERAGMRLRLHDGSAHRDVSCRAGAVAVAGATAVRARTPGRGACEGDRGRWQPAALTRVDALRCGPLEKRLRPRSNPRTRVHSGAGDGVPVRQRRLRDPGRRLPDCRGRRGGRPRALGRA